MNRIQQSPPTAKELAIPSVYAVDAAMFSPAAEKANCSLFVPLHYERNYAYPLIVWLHGSGADENQLKRIMPLISTRNYAAVCPRGLPLKQRASSARQYGWDEQEASVAAAEQQVFDAVKLAQRRLNVARQRIYLAGFDTGGTMAYRLAMSHPQCFAGVLSLCGPFPCGRTPLARLSEARRLPLFMACGRTSSAYPDQQVCEDLRLLHSAGMEVTLRLYPCGHEISPQMLSDMDRWIMEQIATGVTEHNISPADRS